MVDIIIIIVLLAISFFSGMKIANAYNEDLIEYLDYLLRLETQRQINGYVQQPVRRKRFKIGPAFFQRMKDNGRATQMFRNSR